MARIKEIRVKDPVFKISVQVFHSCTAKKFCKKFGFKRFPEVDGRRITGQHDHGGTRNIIRMKKKDISVLAHEIYHLVYNNLSCMGIKPCDETEEVYAYLIGYFTKEILESF